MIGSQSKTSDHANSLRGDYDRLLSCVSPCIEFVSVLIRWTAHIDGLVINALKLAGAAALLLITAGAWPNPRHGAAIALGVCILAAVVLHFAAP